MFIYTHTHIYNVGDVLNCITEKGEVNCTIIEKDTNYIYTLNVSATKQLHRIIMEQKNEINDLKTQLARLEAIINSSLIVDGNTNNGTDA
jgi:hypothetical protein